MSNISANIGTRPTTTRPTSCNSRYHDAWMSVVNGKVAEVSTTGRTATCRWPAATAPKGTDGVWFAVGDEVTVQNGEVTRR